MKSLGGTWPDVHSNQPYRRATAKASNGAFRSHETNGRGYVDIYLYANAGDAIKVEVGRATCHTTAQAVQDLRLSRASANQARPDCLT